MFLTVVFKQWLNTHIPLCNLDCKEGRMPKKWCLRTVVLEKTPESPLDSKEIKPVNLKGDQPWIFTGRTDAEVIWFEQMTHWKSPWCWERSRAEEEEGIRGWDGWTASLMQWTWTWANSGKWWGTGRPGMLQSMGLQRVRHDWATEQQPQFKWCRWRRTHRQRHTSAWVKGTDHTGLLVPGYSSASTLHSE